MNKKYSAYDIFIRFQVLAIILVIIDQVSKFLCIEFLPNYAITGEKVEVIKDFFYLKLVYNTGAAFSILSDSTWLLGFISIAAVVGIEYYIFKYKPKDKIINIILVVLVAGAFGNLIDRVFFQKVTDFLSFIIFGNEFATFNFADICVTLSCISFIIYSLFFYKDDHDKKKKNDVETIEEKNNEL